MLRKGFVKLFVIGFFLICCCTLLVPIWKGRQIIVVHPKNPILPDLHSLIQEALHITNTRTGLGIFLRRRDETHAELQMFLGCLAQPATVDMGASDVVSAYSALGISTACDQTIPSFLTYSWNTSVLCRHLIGMRLLIVGSHMTYRLHNKLLDILPSSSQGSPFRCHGPALCTWHEICASSSQAPSFSSERHRIPPHDLSNSAILRFAMSSTLLPNVFDEANDQSYVSPLTSVREHNSQHWLENAQRSDLILLAKSPVPAPAWSYVSSNSSRTHRFNVKLPNPGSAEWNRMEPFVSLLAPRGLLRESYLVQAAWRATVVKWLPELVETLICLEREKVATKGRVLVWLGSSLVTGCANRLENYDYQTDIQWLQECVGCEDRCMFQNAQVYVQHLLLHEILPRLGVLYIPIAYPSQVRLNAPSSLSTMLSKNRRQFKISMFENATVTHHEVEDTVLRGLVTILQWKKNREGL